MTPTEPDPQSPGTVAKYTLTQAIAEVGLGSLIHGLNLPFGGHALSLNQALILTFATRGSVDRRDAVRATAATGQAVAVLKALSPAGKRFTPMLAIGTQGLLFATGVALFGRSLAGVVLGGALLSLWGFLQPLLIAHLLLGNVFFEAVVKLWTDLAETLHIDPKSGVYVLGALVVAKIVVSAVLTAAGWLSGEKLEERYLRRIDALARKAPVRRSRKKARSPWAGAWRDLLHPWFLLSLGLTTTFFVLSGPEGVHRAVWYVIRTLAIGLLFFWAVRALPPRWTQRALKPFPRARLAVDYAFRKLVP